MGLQQKMSVAVLCVHTRWCITKREKGVISVVCEKVVLPPRLSRQRHRKFERAKFGGWVWLRFMQRPGSGRRHMLPGE